MWKKLEILHTEAVKKKYSKVEREIKRNLTEIMLIKDFKIRELSSDENSKFLSNPSTIKSSILTNTTEKIQSDLFKLIENEVDDKLIAEKYKSLIIDFFYNIKKRNIQKLLKNTKNSKLFIKYISQNKELKNVRTKNVKIQIAKVLYEKFWDEAFTTKSNKKNKEPDVVLSEKALNYICTIFNIANKVWESWGKRIDQVFHDGDFPFITNNIRASENDYINVITYLLDRWKIAYYGKRGTTWQMQWAKKTSQYADILRALTDNQLRIHEYPNLWENVSIFQRDEITKNLFNIWWWLLDNIVTTHNDNSATKTLKLSKRLKNASSSAEKIIEWKKINDAIWFRLSMKWISDQNFDDIKTISKSRFKMFKADLNAHPNKYVPKWQTITIKEISIDNKWILEQDQLDDILSDLNKIAPTNIRKRSPSPYISEYERIERMEKHYPEIVNNQKKWDAVLAFYKRISWWKSRWRNWSYKDFKFNITFEIKDENNKIIWERNMEVQFDDVNNGKWLSNYNIRNFERWVNTQSRLSFSIPLSEARKNCEKHLKNMRLWAKKWAEWATKQEIKEFFEITFNDWSTVNIAWFSRRNSKNSATMDNTIIKIINYFLQKWTFILCYNPNIQEAKEPIIINRLLNVNDLHNQKMMNDLHICSSLELASQQHSYLQQDWSRKVWIPIEHDGNIWRISVGELIDPMNLWKKKDETFSAGL